MSKISKKPLTILGKCDDNRAVKQIKNCLKHESAVGAALMADHHIGISQPIGGVVAYKDAISPTGVGVDIGCGNKCVMIDMDSTELLKNLPTIMDDIFSTISFGMGRVNEETLKEPRQLKERFRSFWDHPSWDLEVPKSLKELTERQLGTIGSGNHFVDLFIDEDSNIWIGVHFGSRGPGNKTANHYMKLAGQSGDMMSPPAVISLDTDMGREYWQCMELMGLFAECGRDWVCDRIAELLGAKIIYEVSNHHNFAWKEIYDGQELVIVRKGATPNFPDQVSFVGGSMGDHSYILEGIDDEFSTTIYNSTIHGAGRVFGRNEAKGTYEKMKVADIKDDEFLLQNGISNYDKKKFRNALNSGNMEKKFKVRVGDGKVTKKMMTDWIEDFDVELRGGGLDESPHCYKRIDEVLEFQGFTVEVVNQLKPVGVLMSPPDTYDPYKD